MIPRHFQIAISLLLLSILLIGISLTRMPEQSPASSQSGPAGPPVAGKQEQVRVLVAYDYDQALRWRDAEAFMPEDRGLRAREAVRSILSQYLQSPSPHPLGKGADVKDVYWIGNDTLVVDMTPQFADGHPSGVLVEQLTLVSLIETLNANVPGISKVKFLVNGQERETLAGHADLMSFYQTAAIHDLAKEFE
jgi:hypothetical protein